MPVYRIIVLALATAAAGSAAAETGHPSHRLTSQQAILACKAPVARLAERHLGAAACNEARFDAARMRGGWRVRAVYQTGEDATGRLRITCRVRERHLDVTTSLNER